MIILVILGFNAMVILFVEEKIVIIVYIFILLSGVIRIYLRKKDTKKYTPISNDVAEAMASKIIFEAKQHRQIREKDEYLIIDLNEEE